jgi:hypothetical protein
LVAVARFWVLRSRGGVLDDVDLEAVFGQLAQMRIHAKARGHSRKAYLRDGTLAPLQCEVFRVRAVHLVWADNDRLTVVHRDNGRGWLCLGPSDSALVTSPGRSYENRSPLVDG